MKKIAITLMLVTAGWLSAGAANALYTFGGEASLPGGWVVFQDFESPIVADYAPATSVFPNMTFSVTGSVPDMYVTPDFSPYVGPNSRGQSIVNFDYVNFVFAPTPTSVTFDTVRTALVFSFQIYDPVTFTTLLDGIPTATFTVPASGVNSLYYGFSGVMFNRLQFDTAGFYVMDNFAVAAVPEPETFAMMLAGLGLMGFVARRRSQLQEAADTIA